MRRDLDHNIRSPLPKLLLWKDKEWLAVATAATVPRPFCYQSFRKRRVPLSKFSKKACTQNCAGCTTPNFLHGTPNESTVRIYRRILQSEIISHPTRKTHCRMNEISRKFPEIASSVKNGLGGEGASQHGASGFCAPNAKILTEVSEKSYTPKNPVRRRADC